MKIAKTCDMVIRIAFCLLFLIVPLILTTVNFELFEFNKMLATYALSIIIGLAWTVKSVALGKLRIARTPLDVPILLFATSQLVSTLFSIDTHVSWFGYYSRFNGGMLSILSYIFLYYAFVSNLISRTEPVGDQKKIKKLNASAVPVSASHSFIRVLLRVCLTTGVVVAAYGIAEHYGIDKSIWVQDVQNRVFSTLGQPNWLAAYLVAFIPVALGLGLAAIKRAKDTEEPDVLHSAGYLTTIGVAAVFFLTLLYTRSRSGLLGLAIADLAFWAVIVRWITRKRILFHIAVIHILLLGILFFTGTHIDAVDRFVTLSGWKTAFTKTAPAAQPAPADQKPTGPLLETGGTESGTIRKYVWEAAITAWRSSTKTFLIGTGTETFAFAFFQYKPIGHNLTSEWDFLYNKAHNEYLNFLATTGLFGLASYALLLMTFIVWAVRSYIFSPCTGPDPLTCVKSRIIGAGLLAGYVSILVTNFFGFSVVVTQLILFLFPAIVFVLREESDPQTNPRFMTVVFDTGGANGTVAYLVLGIAAVFGLYSVSVAWVSDRDYAYGHNLTRSGQYAIAYPYLTQAVMIRPGEPVFHEELSGTLAVMALAYQQNNDASRAAELGRRSISEIDRAIAISPKNVNFRKTKTRVLYTLADLDPNNVQLAADELDRALELSPSDPKILYNLAVLDGKLGKRDEALKKLQQTILMKPNYRDAYYALAVFYKDAGQYDLATQTVQAYLTNVDPNDEEMKKLTQ